MPDLHQSKPQNPYIMDNVFKFMGGFFSSLTQLLIGFAALAVVTEVVSSGNVPRHDCGRQLDLTHHDAWQRRICRPCGPLDPLEHPYEEVSD